MFQLSNIRILDIANRSNNLIVNSVHYTLYKLLEFALCICFYFKYCYNCLITQFVNLRYIFNFPISISNLNKKYVLYFNSSISKLPGDFLNRNNPVMERYEMKIQCEIMRLSEPKTCEDGTKRKRLYC